MTGDAMKLILADDNYLVREGTASLLREIDEVDLVATVDGPDALLAAVARHRPDAVVTDIRMPPTQSREGIDAAKKIRRSYPGTAVLLLSQHVEGAYIGEAVYEVCVFNGGVFPGFDKSPCVHYDKDTGKVDGSFKLLDEELHINDPPLPHLPSSVDV